MSEEYERILSNPDNLIISDELREMFETDKPEDVNAYTLVVGTRDFSCYFISMTRNNSLLAFEFEVPTLNVSDLLGVESVSAVIGDFQLENCAVFDFSIEDGKRILRVEKSTKKELL